MWRKQGTGVFKVRNGRAVFLIVGLCFVGLLLLAGCSAANNASSAAPVTSQRVPQSASGSASGQQASNTAQYGPQYLEKNLQVTMQVRDTRQAASDLQQWVSQVDTQATSDGADFEQGNDNQYIITLTFLIDASHYDQVKAYLSNYPGQQGGTLISLNETVQDVTNDYVDTQSTLTNLRAEQQRLLSLLSQAQSINDILNVEQQLTQVEGQINDIEAHLNELKGQTTFYPVTITLQPVGGATASGPWSVIPIWQGAWSAVVNVWEILAALLVWLAAFSVYIVPIAGIVWLLRKRPWNRTPRLIANAPTGLTGKSTDPQPK